MPGQRRILAVPFPLAAQLVTEAGVKARRFADTETPAHGLDGPPSRRPRPPGRTLGALSASSMSFVPADGLSPSQSALYVLIVAGLVCLALVQLRALRRARAAATEATAKADGLERELLKRREMEEASPQREERYRTPLDQSRDYTIFLEDAEGKPTSWHSGVRRLLGYEKAEFLRMSSADLYTPEDREAGAPERDFSEATEHGQASSERWVVRKDGSRLWASISISSVTDRHGRLLGFSKRLRDLSQRKHAEEELRRKQEALELAIEAGGLGTWEYELASGEMLLGRARQGALRAPRGRDRDPPPLARGDPTGGPRVHQEAMGTGGARPIAVLGRNVGCCGPTAAPIGSWPSASAPSTGPQASRVTWRASCSTSPSGAAPRNTCGKACDWRR